MKLVLRCCAVVVFVLGATHGHAATNRCGDDLDALIPLVKFLPSSARSDGLVHLRFIAPVMMNEKKFVSLYLMKEDFRAQLKVVESEDELRGILLGTQEELSTFQLAYTYGTGRCRIDLILPIDPPDGWAGSIR